MTFTSESRSCQHCKREFMIEPDDFAFYEKIEVPPPTWCPECRMLRKLMWVNNASLHRGACAAPGHGEDILHRFSPQSPYKTIYDHTFWYSDAWDPLSYGRDYDFTRPFFMQLLDLFVAFPWRNLALRNTVNCEYSLNGFDSKNCYLVAGCAFSENCMYADTPAFSKDCVDVSITMLCDTLYECYSCTRCFDLAYAAYCIESMNSRFLYDCRNVSDCFGCVGLRNKQHCIWNKQYSKKEYQAEMAKIDLGDRQVLLAMKQRFLVFAAPFPRRFMRAKNAIDCTGDDIEGGKNCIHCFELRDNVENCKYVLLGGQGLKDSQDVFGGGLKSQLLYDTQGLDSERVFFSDSINNSFDIRYSEACGGSSHLFGCIGLRKKQYCIFNKQYSKEEYEALVPKIIQHMNDVPYTSPSGEVYRYGEFFPLEMAPYAYNESLAREYIPRTRKEIEALDLPWITVADQDYPDAMPPDDLPQHIKDAADDIAERIIRCMHRAGCEHLCKGAFRITPQELAFYRRMNVPVPELCPNCRHFERVEGKRRFSLHARQCQCKGPDSEKGEYRNTRVHFHGTGPCPNEFQTAYAPDRPETVYCEECYSAEIT